MSNEMQKFRKIEHTRGTNPVRVFNKKFSNIDICARSKIFTPSKGKNIIKTSGDPAFNLNDDNEYVSQMDELGYEKDDTFTPFQLLTILRFKDNWQAAMVFVSTEYMNKDIPYIRVGTDYYKKIKKRNRWGIMCRKLKPWTKDAIKTDHNSSFLKFVKRFDDFDIEPDNGEYSETVGGYWNLYEPFPHEPYDGDVSVTDIPTSASFISHVFGKQQELGWKYMKVLYEKPKQVLPVLVLVSRERQTGKTSFLNWLDILFANNYTVISSSDLTNAFNSQYAYKNIIGVDEAVVDKKAGIEKIKSLATTKKVMVNTKNVSQYDIPFFGKIVMTTNKEKDFMRVDSEEIRFWVRKLNTIPEDDLTDDFYDRLIKEIPKLLTFLETKIDVEYGRSRMVFTYDEIHNKYIADVKSEARSGLHKDIEIHAQEWFKEHTRKNELYMRLKDIKTHWFPHDNSISPHYIKKVLTQQMDIESEGMGRYHFFVNEGPKESGDPYMFSRSDYLPESIDDSKSKNADVPF